MWLDILRKEVETKGSVQVARELCISRTTVDLVVQGKYQASTARVQERVWKVYGNNGAVQCPVLGEIEPITCAQKWALAKKIGMRAGNPETLKLYKTCMSCGVRR